jgi:hypothetical protein
MDNRSISVIFCLLAFSIVADISIQINGNQTAQFSGVQQISPSTSILARVVHDSGDGSPPPTPPDEKT